MIPLATTTITVERTELLATADPYDAVTANPETVASGVRAHLSAPGGIERQRGQSQQEDVAWRLACDPCEMTADCIVVDDATGDRFEIEWARLRTGLGIDHIEASLRQVTGVV